MSSQDPVEAAKLEYCKARSACDYYWERGQASGYTYQENGRGGTSMLDRARQRMQMAISKLKELGVEYQDKSGDHLPWAVEILDHCSAGNYFPPKS